MRNRLSIMIPSLKSRADLLSTLVCHLIPQCGAIKGIKSFNHDACLLLIISFYDVEIIICIDEKSITTGAKRNLLLSYAVNDYVVSVDDDDEVPGHFVSSILMAIQSGADVIGTNGTISTNGGNFMQWYLSKDYPNVTKHINGVNVYWRTSNHLSPVKRELALLAGYPDKSAAEDKAYSEALVPHLKTESVINEPLYHYKYSTFNKEY